MNRIRVGRTAEEGRLFRNFHPIIIIFALTNDFCRCVVLILLVATILHCYDIQWVVLITAGGWSEFTVTLGTRLANRRPRYFITRVETHGSWSGCLRAGSVTLVRYWIL